MNNIQTFIACSKREQNRILLDVPIEIIKIICSYAAQSNKKQIHFDEIGRNCEKIIKIFQNDVNELILIVSRSLLTPHDLCYYIVVHDTKNNKHKLFYPVGRLEGNLRWFMKSNKIYALIHSIRSGRNVFSMIAFTLNNYNIKKHAKIFNNIAYKYSVCGINKFNNDLYLRIKSHDQSLRTRYTLTGHGEDFREFWYIYKIDTVNAIFVDMPLKFQKNINLRFMQDDKCRLSRYFTRNNFINISDIYDDKYGKVVYVVGNYVHIIYHQFSF